MKVKDYTVVFAQAPTKEEALALLTDGVKQTLSLGWTLQGGISISVVARDDSPTGSVYHAAQSMIEIEF